MDWVVCIIELLTVYRKVGKGSVIKLKSARDAPKTSGKTSGKILDTLKEDERLAIPEPARLIGVTERSIERNIRKLQEQGLLRRIGAAKGGHWKVME